MSEIPANWYADESMTGTERYWDGTAWTEQIRPTPPPPPPAPASPPPPMVPPTAARAPATEEPGGHGSFKISEDGKNGSVEIGEKGLSRVLKKTLGKDDRQFIPYSSISMVSHDRKRMGRDVVTVQVGTTSYDWKIQLDAEGFVDQLNDLIA